MDASYYQVPTDEECVLNAVQLGKLIDEPATTIRTWAGLHEQWLYIKKINDRFVYTQASIDQFKFIKDLCRHKNFTHKQISEHLSKHGFNYSQYDSGLVDPKDPLGYTALSSSLALENAKQLKKFMEKFVEFQKENNKILIKEMKKEVSTTVEEKIEESLKDFKEELAVTKEINETLDNLRTKMEERKKVEEERNENKGFFSRFRKR